MEVYFKKWFLCQLPSAAPRHDLEFLKEVKKYDNVNKKISKLVTCTFLRHTWYLSEQLIALAFFDNQISISEKESMITALEKKSNIKNKIKAVILEKNIENAKLEHFVSETTIDFFKIMNNNKLPQFLEMSPGAWTENEEYLSIQKKVQQLAVVNDHAERGIAMITEFNGILTNHEEQKQYLLQVVEKHRKEFPNFNKCSIINGLKQ